MNSSVYREEFFGLLKLGIPLALAHLAQNTISFVDTLMAGRLGNDAIAGIALGSTTFYLVIFVISGVLLGVNPIVSQAQGANDDEKITNVLRQSFVLSVGLLIPSWLLLYNAESLFHWLQQPPDVARQSGDYLKAISWGLLPAFLFLSLRSALESLSDTRPILLISLVNVILNVVANEVLMFGRFGLPALGLVGTGYASALVMAIACLLSMGYFRWRYPRLKIFSLENLFSAVNRRQMWELICVGVPIGMTIGFETSMFSASAFAMGWFGKDALAAHQIALQTASIAFMVPLGISIAASVRVGQAVGAGDMFRTKIVGYMGIVTSGAVMVISAACFVVFSREIIGLYLDLTASENVAVITIATSFLWVAAAFGVFDGLQVGGSMALRGFKDTRAAMLLTLLAYWGCGVTSGAVFAFVLGYEGLGLWYGLTTGLAVAAVILFLRFRSHFPTHASESFQ
jgi:MATE family multidrug resistance protein